MKILIEAKTAEEIFGNISSLDELKKEFRKLCKLVHPDTNKSDEATAAFESLNKFYIFAQELIKKGDYGKKILLNRAKEIITFGKNTITNIRSFKSGKIAELKLGELNGKKIILKISKNPKDNDLLLQEFEALKRINEVKGDDLERMRENHIVKILHSFMFKDRRINILEYKENYVTLDSVKERVDERSLVWIWKRMAAALIVCHEAGVIHNAVLPDNFLLDLESHNGVLIDFCYSTFDKPKVIDKDYKSFYAPEVFNKEKLKAQSDIFLMGNTIRNSCKNITKRLDSLAKACILTHGRLQDASAVYRDVVDAAFKNFGEPKFHHFPK